MSDLRSVVYVSSATMPLTAEALEALLVEARDLNLQSNTTGVLLCCDGTFMQCFEGSPEAVDATYERIRKSRRHTALIELMDEPVRLRSFADWQMGFLRATTSEILTLSTARWRSTSRRSGPCVSPGLELLQQFWKQAR